MGGRNKSGHGATVLAHSRERIAHRAFSAAGTQGCVRRLAELRLAPDIDAKIATIM